MKQASVDGAVIPNEDIYSTPSCVEEEVINIRRVNAWPRYGISIIFIEYCDDSASRINIMKSFTGNITGFIT